MELESKVEELNRTKQINDKRLGEAIVQATKVSQLQTEKEEMTKKIEKYNTTIESLIKSLDAENEKYKQLQTKYDNLLANSNMHGKGHHDKNHNNIGLPNKIIPAKVSNSLITDSVPLLNTICELQRERKMLKSKLMKDKLQDLFNEESNINKLIKRKKKTYISEEKDLYSQIEDQVININDNYRVI
jgi:hypothetical protein